MLLTEIDFISKKKLQKYAFMNFYLNSLKILFALQIKVIAFYVQVFIKQSKIFGFRKPIHRLFFKTLLILKLEPSLWLFFIQICINCWNNFLIESRIIARIKLKAKKNFYNRKIFSIDKEATGSYTIMYTKFIYRDQ